ncbi:MAG TPA: tRNA (adenosine(37)-N6)-threonylcarbamoyltransferase complex dimerization subunit type 1 TsaB [Candidatus Peribacteraceae bacterium]|nr:tRNA (adenosine(37)-N6)-threonylcarbamoyltransferase complex dimerization subunit type 1 TsaB [Candidatus Peribacteraceae bacterium]
MNTLFLDIATHTSSSLDGSSGMIACVDDAVVSKIAVDDRMSDTDLMPAVEKALKDAGWNYQDLTQIACVIGPGGFTSLRMGVSLANALADQLKIPSAGVHLSDLYRARVMSDDFLWMHSTKKTELFVRGFGSLQSQWPEATLVGIDEFVSTVGAWHGSTALTTGAMPLHVCGELIPDHREKIPRWTALPLRPLADVLPSLLANLLYKTDLLLPWYGRMW